MKVKSSALISQLVVHIDNDRIIDGSTEDWKRPLVVDANGRTVKGSVRICCDPGDIPIVGNGRCTHEIGGGGGGESEEQRRYYREERQGESHFEGF